MSGDEKVYSVNWSEKHVGASEKRPMGDGIMIRGRRGKIFAQGYVPGGEGPFPTVILLHGLPGHEQNLDLFSYHLPLQRLLG